MSDCCGISCFLLCGFISSETLSTRQKCQVCPEQFTPPGTSFAERLLRSACVETFSTIDAAKFPINKRNLFISKKLTNRLSMAALASVEYRCSDLC